MTATAYQTLEDRANDDFVEQNGPFECTRQDAWFGDGYYFWDTRILWAHEWGRNAYRKSDYIIGETKLDISNCYDLLGNVEHEVEFEQIYELLVSRLAEGEETPKVSEVIEYLKRHLDFTYHAIRGYDEPTPMKVAYSAKRPSVISLNRRVQICVINVKAVSLRPFRIVHPIRTI